MNIDDFPKEIKMIQQVIRQIRGLYWDKMYQQFWYKRRYYTVFKSTKKGDKTTIWIKAKFNRKKPDVEYKFIFKKNQLLYDGIHDHEIKALKPILHGTQLDYWLNREVPYNRKFDKYQKRKFLKVKKGMTQKEIEHVCNHNRTVRNRRKRYEKKYYLNVTKRRRTFNKPPRKPVLLTCIICGDEFVAFSRVAKYCEECKKNKELINEYKRSKTD